MPSRTYAVYVMTSRRDGPLYVGVTSDLAGRVWQHRNGTLPGFTKRYGLARLVHHETFEDINEAIAFEKRLKRWRRAWKIALIERENPDWRDLWPEISSP